MSRLSITLPDDLKTLVDQQVASGAYGDQGEYVRSLIRKDQQRLDRERLETMLLSRRDEGNSVVMDAADIRSMRDDYLRARTPKAQNDGRKVRKPAPRAKSASRRGSK